MNNRLLLDATVLSKNNRVVPGTRAALLLATAAMLSGCSLAPGQHMIEPAALPVTSADNGDVTNDIQIPIKQIDLTLIRQIRADEKNIGKTAGQLGLFANLRKIQRHRMLPLASWWTATATCSFRMWSAPSTHLARLPSKFSAK